MKNKFNHRTLISYVASVAVLLACLHSACAAQTVSSFVEQENLFWMEIHSHEDNQGLLYTQWSLADQAEISKLEKELRIDIMQVEYLVPTSSILSVSEVKRIAADAVSNAFAVDMESLHPFQISYVKWKDQNKAYWYVSFFEGGYCLLTEDGIVTDNIVHGKLTPQAQYEQYGKGLTVELAAEQYGVDTVFRWPLEVQAKLPYHGMPCEEKLSEQDAIAMAKKAIESKTGIPIPDNYLVYSTYWDKGPWKIYFFQTINELYAEAEIDADTGEVLEVYTDSNG